jgi:hypothetical protein
MMRAVEGMSTAESAECLDITEETAKTSVAFAPVRVRPLKCRYRRRVLDRRVAMRLAGVTLLTIGHR